MKNYWLVGAAWGGVDHQDKKFVSEGYWMLGWDKEKQPDQYELASKINIGDNIAIKRMNGQGASDIKIYHIGIIKGVILEANKIICTVNWVATDLKRDVESRGCFKSIHGPYPKDSWIEHIFCRSKLSGR